MSYVVINAITVPPDRRDAIEERFANRAGEVSKAEGFESFEFLRPVTPD
ncbi:MAG TPA: antibiotic biosynthesis monooxygenase, partial [Actinomycetota bacterium]|nr:antibiotic biosynthesis monooxygenase [Actinomycetota bacterium]